MVKTDIDPQLVGTITDSVMSALLQAGAIKPVKGKHKRVNWESVLMREYVEKFYGDQPHWYKIGVGPIPKENEGKLYAITQRWADAIVRTPDGMLIIEGKMRCKPDVASQLLNYGDLFPQTPLFTKYKDEKVKLKVVCAMIDDTTKAFIEKHNIEVEMYKPSNYEAWYKFVIERNAEA